MAEHHEAEGVIEHAGNASIRVVRNGTFKFYISSIWCVLGVGASLFVIPLSYVAPAFVARYILLFEENCRTIMIVSSILSLCGIGMMVEVIPHPPQQDKIFFVATTITEEAIGHKSISILNALAWANTLRRFAVGLWVGLMVFGLVKMIK